MKTAIVLLPSILAGYSLLSFGNFVSGIRRISVALLAGYAGIVFLLQILNIFIPVKYLSIPLFCVITVCFLFRKKARRFLAEDSKSLFAGINGYLTILVVLALVIIVSLPVIIAQFPITYEAWSHDNFFYIVIVHSSWP